MRLWLGTLLVFLTGSLWAQPGNPFDNPLQPQLDFEKALIEEVEQVGDTERLTSAQKKAAWEELEKRLVAKLGAKPWVITLRVEDVRADSRNPRLHEVRFEPTIAVPGSSCTWRFNGNRIKLPIDKAAAAKIHKGDYIDFTGVPLKLAADAPNVKKVEYERRINRGLAVPITIQHEKAASFSVVVAELKYKLTK